jgi:hypothetical protein
MDMDNDTNQQHSDYEQRLKNYFGSIEKTWSSCEELAPGVWVYHDVLPPELQVISRIEEVLSDPTSPYQYREALVGYGVKMPEYRDCYDYKFKKSDIEHDQGEHSLKLQQIWQDCHDRMLNAVKDYSSKYNMGELRYWEAMNFIKYGPEQHFMEHTDQGFSYNCVLSLVAYPNDDYEGGELSMRLWDLKIKARAGDVLLFPSNFMYPHTAEKVISGTKYSIVTMLDYSSKYHTREMYTETND